MYKRQAIRRALRFYRVKDSALSCLVDSRRIVRLRRPVAFWSPLLVVHSYNTIVVVLDIVWKVSIYRNFHPCIEIWKFRYIVLNSPRWHPRLTQVPDESFDVSNIEIVSFRFLVSRHHIASIVVRFSFDIQHLTNMVCRHRHEKQTWCVITPFYGGP